MIKRADSIIMKSRVSRPARTHTAIVTGRALTMDSKPERSAGRLEKSTSYLNFLLEKLQIHKDFDTKGLNNNNIYSFTR